MDGQEMAWCDVDKQQSYGCYSDFNRWLEYEEQGQIILKKFGIDGLAHPSKALYAGDQAKYLQAYSDYRENRLHEILNESYLLKLSGNDHWFTRNLARFDQLLTCLEKGNVVPFLGAGISVAGGFPTWKDHLRQQGETAGIDSSHIKKLLADGQYEIIISEIEEKRGHEVFTQEIRDAFSHRGSIPDVVKRITELFSATIITTNYDGLIDHAYKKYNKHEINVINCMIDAMEAQSEKVNIYKLHGDIDKPKQCILSKDQYNEAYGENTLDIEKPIPKFLANHFRKSNLLFLGCSLNNDRTIQVFKAAMAQFVEKPQHFSIEQAPDDINTLVERNAQLANLGITAIWFEKECFEYVEKILSFTNQEFSIRQQLVIDVQEHDKTDTELPVKQETDLSIFLRDFIDLMPLMYWIHRPVPQTETNKYLQAMQCVFYAYSFFTENTNENLISGIDLLLRAFSNNASFDGYTHEKLSGAFSNFQHYLQDLGEENELYNKFSWNPHELITIPLTQFEHLLESRSIESNLDYHAIRLIIALLKHGRKQEHSPKEYCELPHSVNHEFSDYLSLILSLKLGLHFPDRLNDMDAGDINSLCQDAWENLYKQDDKIGLFESIKLMLFRK
jgi:NAD-dependent SIR2 family protein deacetylase